jgi:O-antigen ligase
MIPAMIAMLVTNHGARRIIWLGCLVASAVVLLLTVSRGAFVGLFVGTIWAAFACRRYVPISRFAMWAVVAAVGVVLTVAVASLADPHIGDVVADRLFGQTKSYDLGDASSGRTQIWAELLSRMIRTPITFLTGFGWDVYSVMPFLYAPHNHYLGTWFDLGIVGVTLFVLILATIIVTVFRVIPMARAQTRPFLLAFIFGMLSLAVAIVFADLFDPWSYIWLYCGVMLRMAMLVREGADEPVTARATEEPLRVATVAAPALREGRSAFGGVLTGRPR